MKGTQGFLPFDEGVPRAPEPQGLEPETFSAEPKEVVQDDERKALFHDAIRRFDLLRAAGPVLGFEEQELEEAFRRFAQADTHGVAFPIAEEGEPQAVTLQRELEGAFVAAVVERWRGRVGEFPELERLEEEAEKVHARGAELTDLQVRRVLGVKNSYEERIERRRERLERAAVRAEERSDHFYRRSSEIVAHIPLGQPILVGHHSEKRHRRDIEKCHRAMDRSVEELRRKEELERMANAVGKGGISSDDPDAVPKLKEELAALEQERELMKRVNAQFRRGGWQAVDGLSDGARARLEAAMARAPWVKAPFESFALSNIGANIRRIRTRMEELEARKEETPRLAVEGPGFRIEDAQEDNRVRIFFDSKPEEGVRRLLKQHGFRWSPNASAWQRQLNAAGRSAAERVSEVLRTLEGKNPV